MAATAGYASLNQYHDETDSTTKQSGHAGSYIKLGGEKSSVPHAVIHAGKPDAHGTLVNSSSPARGVELRWDLRSPARGVELRWDLRSPARGVELPMTWGRGVRQNGGGRMGWGIEQGGVGTEEEDVPRNMLCQTGICE
ncbi:hypothetical protein Bbelb_308840 [Branchiostoma belcheri]|nr:hypothetical protein Bbelb_308840 [Branchiostoma belcheri]